MKTPYIHGKWTGTITYGKKYAELNGKELYFDLEIIQDGELITGTSVDIGGIGTSPDAASISGTFKANAISFIKRYNSFHYFDRGNTVVDKSQPGYEIYYTGVYNETQQTFRGNWEYRVRYNIFWIFSRKYVVGGTWSMRHK